MLDNPRPMIHVTVMTIPVTASVFMARAYIGNAIQFRTEPRTHPNRDLV